MLVLNFAAVVSNTQVHKIIGTFSSKTNILSTGFEMKIKRNRRKVWINKVGSILKDLFIVNFYMRINYIFDFVILGINNNEVNISITLPGWLPYPLKPEIPCLRQT